MHSYDTMVYLIFVFIVICTVATASRHHGNMKEREKKIHSPLHTGPNVINRWPHLLGKSVDEARLEIKRDRPEVQIISVSKNAIVTMDYRIDRVRLFVEEDGFTIARPPSVG
mmetsp:Transcript_25780/g.43013  ORF Transcript_25780/g.43013 Transcript_25780/m.43013 type:complete len:112 (-) Transcript_25780:92-427(-)